VRGQGEAGLNAIEAHQHLQRQLKQQPQQQPVRV
jgi:hypothetical protein